MQARKIIFTSETVYAEGGKEAPRPVTRAVGIAVIANPYAGRYVQDLSPLFDTGVQIAEQLMPELVKALAGKAVAYGKAAIVGVNGDIEHAAALLHPKMGRPMRAAIGGAVPQVLPECRQISLRPQVRGRRGVAFRDIRVGHERLEHGPVRRSARLRHPAHPRRGAARPRSSRRARRRGTGRP